MLQTVAHHFFLQVMDALLLGGDDLLTVGQLPGVLNAVEQGLTPGVFPQQRGALVLAGLQTALAGEPTKGKTDRPDQGAHYQFPQKTLAVKLNKPDDFDDPFHLVCQ
jgi:hypothetical protein